MWSSAKIAATAIIFVISFVPSLLPCVVVRCLHRTLGTSPKFNRVISLLNCFAGGVFFATFLLDMLPEARETMEDVLQERGIDFDFALTECLTGTGFLVVLFIEQLAHRCFSKHQDNDGDSHGHHDHFHDFASAMSKYSTFDNVQSDEPSNNSQHHNSVSTMAGGTLEGATNVASLTDIEPTSNGNNQQTTRFDAGKLGEDNKVAESTAIQYQASRKTDRTKSLRTLILLGALSFHMVFEGMALGLLQKTSEIWQLVLALSIHKALVFFTIGLQILELLKSIGKVVLVGLVFSLVSPLGILIGELLSGGNDVNKDTVSAVLQSFAIGTFLFVTFFEILQKELNAGGHDLLKVFSTIVGYGIVVIIKLFMHEG